MKKGRGAACCAPTDPNPEAMLERKNVMGMVQRTARTGDTVFCRACKGKLILHQQDGSFEAEVVGRTDNAIELQAEINSAALDDLMREYAGNFR